jgi:hypothetical protein
MSAQSEVTLLPTVIHQDRTDSTFPPRGWKAEPLRELEELLAPYVGPMARVLIKVFKVTGSEEAPNRSSPDLANKPIEAVDVDKATGRLAPYVGPIAKVMAKKAAAQARDLKGFYERLAENLDPGDRERFLKDVGYEP